jgi:hypothetical protein
MSASEAEAPPFCTIMMSLTLTSSIKWPGMPAMIAGMPLAGASQMILLSITRFKLPTPAPAGARKRAPSLRKNGALRYRAW